MHRHKLSVLGGLIIMLVGAAAAADETDWEWICRYHEQADARSQQAADNNSSAQSTRHYAPSRLVDVVHLKIDVIPDFKSRSISGWTTITFRPIAKPLSEWKLDIKNLLIRDVKSETPIADYTATTDDLTILFDPPIQPDQQVNVAIEHYAEPTQGVYYRTPDMGYPETDAQLWTHGETHEARHWFPCFDHPNERSSTEVICHAPTDMTVLSNGRLVSESKADPESGLKEVRWLQEKPHPTYLVTLTVGYFDKLEDKHGDTPLTFYAPPSLSKHAANSFRDTAKIMAFYEQEIGVPYPWDQYGQVAVYDFVAGGMENTSMTTLTERTIFSSETENIRSSHRLDAHEMAHQWFGDYVTCKDWSHLWLNEGFATYYTHLYEGHKFGRDHMLYGLWRDAHRRVLPRANDPRPIVYKDYKDTDEQFDYRAYPKGGWVLHMLRNQLGEDLYRQSIKTYLERHALDSVVTQDLNAVIEELSGRSFDPFFDQWVYHAGSPKLKINYRWLVGDKLAKVSVEQTQPTNDHVRLFSFPVKLRFVVDGKAIDREVEITKRKHDFYLPLSAKPSIVRFDPDYTVLAKVSFKKPDDMLFTQLENADDMVGRLYAIEALGERKTKLAVDQIKKSLQNDGFYGVRIAASRALGEIHNDDAFEALTQSLDQPDARVRLEVVEALGRFYRPETLELLEKQLEKEKNPAIQAAAIEALGHFDPMQTRPLIVRYLNSESFRNQLADAAVDAIGQQRDSTYQEVLMTTLADRESAFDSRSFGGALRTLARISRDQGDKSAVRQFLNGYLNHSRQRIRIAAISALGELRDPTSQAVLETMIGDDVTDRVEVAAQRALEQLQKESPLVSDEVGELRKILTQLKKDNAAIKKDVDNLKAKHVAADKTKAADAPPDSALDATPEDEAPAETEESAQSN